MAASIDKKGNIILIRLSTPINDESLKSIEEHAKLVAETKPAAVAFDFTALTDLKPDETRVLTLCSRTYKKMNIPVYAFSVKTMVLETIKVKGLDTAFVLKKDFADVEALHGKAPKPALDVTFVNPFIQATVKTLKVQANTEVKIGKPHLKTEEAKGIDVASIISLSSPSFKGAIALCFPAAVFLGIYNGMFGENQTKLTAEIQDAAGELMNIIFGQAKIELNDKHGHQIEKAIPTVVSGENLKLKHLTGSKGMILPFSTEKGDFFLEIGME